ncbi:hypothetical protein DYB26_001869 [Aphanomyces astaci]|uniref:Retroviral polymerase SH3-like domain-containing protein n=1 Tax=Aphanomyces astaci TaxID=112090 RepID=A0A397AUU4_APHAT|nr:hypothetical protein DYB36_001911 [Aphanomyces astaci]RHZ38858.1 hypothetical protein DYB26_001869 [Aphanomyces astaci]
MKWNTKQESLPQFLELYEIVLQKLRVSGYAVHDAMVVVLDMLLWQIRHVTHQVDSLPRGQGNNLATVRVILECEYKAPVRSGALTNPRSGNNDERALTAREQPNSDDAQQDAVVFHTFDFQGQVLMDSGASSHMTGDATNLADVQAYQHAVVVVNGAKTHATKMDVLLIDNMPSTLLSVTAMMRANCNFSLTFDAMECSIKHDETTIATATQDTKNKVYVLDQADTYSHPPSDPKEQPRPKVTKCVMMGYAEHQNAYKLYHLDQKRMVTIVQVQFRENEFLGERAQIDEYLVTADADDDDEDGLTEGGTSARPATAYVSTPYTRVPSRSAAAAPPAKRSHFKILPLSQRISDDLYRTRLDFDQFELGTPGSSCHHQAQQAAALSGENLEVVCTYVDDFLVMAKTATMANKILDELKTKMKLERQGDAAYFLGEQSKHIDVRHYYARQPMGIGTIEVRHVGTADQLADVLTKVSTKDAIMKCKNAAMDAPFRAPTAYETSILDAIIAGSLILDQPPNFLRQLLPPDEIALFHDQMRVHFGYLQVSINVSIKISADMASPALDRQFFPTYLKQDAIAEAECDNLRRDMNSCHLHPDGHKLIVVFNSKPRQPSGATASFHFAN